MDYCQAMEYIHSFQPLGGQSQLGDMQTILQRLGNPQKAYKCIHVAGTNGKGSVCAFLDGILRENCYSVGLFTSPYLVRFNERICIDNQPIEDGLLAECTEAVKEEYEKLKSEKACVLSQFGFITLIMFLAFQKAGVDFAVLETGLGGLLDPTNICSPLLSIITSIGLDHTVYLGDTIDKIAANKAGIIKKNVPVLFAPAQNSVREIFISAGNAKGSSWKEIKQDDISIINSDIDGLKLGYKHKEYELQMLGRHQAINGALAIEAAFLLKQKGYRMNGIGWALHACVWPGRLEVLCKKPLIILDGAHNAQGAESLVSWAKEALNEKKIIMVAAFTKDKDAQSIAGILHTICQHFVLTSLPNERSADLVELSTLFRSFNTQVQTEVDPVKAVLLAADGADENTAVIICGSLFLAGAIKAAEEQLKGNLCLID